MLWHGLVSSTGRSELCESESGVERGDLEALLCGRAGVLWKTHYSALAGLESAALGHDYLVSTNFLAFRLRNRWRVSTERKHSYGDRLG